MNLHKAYGRKMGMTIFTGAVILTLGCHREDEKAVPTTTEKTNASAVVHHEKMSHVNDSTPKFNDFLAGKTYQGATAEAQDQQVYYWPMTSANEEIKRALNEQPNYASEYRVFTLDCGIDNCTMTYIGNKRTGQIISAFRSASLFDDNGREIDKEGEETLDYQVDSKLLITRNNPTNGKPVKNFYVMENGVLKKIHSMPTD